MSDTTPQPFGAQLDVILVDEQDEAVDTHALGELARAVLTDEGVHDGMITLAFVDEAAIRDLKLRHLGVDEATDVLAFPMDVSALPPGMPVLLGDVIICPSIARANVGEPADDETWHAETFEDELALLVVHGLLHIRGHDHVDAEQRTVMRNRERELLDRYHRA